jgi:hypothetical protein
MDGQGHHHPHSPQDAPGIELCEACERPFVVPVALLDLVDEGLYLLALHCKNCGRLAVAEHEDAEVERLEHEMTQATAQIAAAADLVEVSRVMDELGPFRDALARDLVLPEDF